MPVIGLIGESIGVFQADTRIVASLPRTTPSARLAIHTQGFIDFNFSLQQHTGPLLATTPVSLLLPSDNRYYWPTGDELNSVQSETCIYHRHRRESNTFYRL